MKIINITREKNSVQVNNVLKCESTFIFQSVLGYFNSIKESVMPNEKRKDSEVLRQGDHPIRCRQHDKNF